MANNDETKSISTRKIANGYLTTEYSDAPGGYNETYSATKPMISVDRSDAPKQVPSSLSKAMKTLGRSS